MYGLQGLYCFELDDQFVPNDEVRAEATSKDFASVSSGDLDLLLKGNSRILELTG